MEEGIANAKISLDTTSGRRRKTECRMQPGVGQVCRMRLGWETPDCKEGWVWPEGIHTDNFRCLV